MATNDKLVGVLNDLIEINTDRITGYEKASDETKDVDVDLQAIFNKMADESRQYKAELTQGVSRLGGEPAEGRTKLGSIFQVWMDVKATFTGHDRQSVLESCEFGEDAAQKAYSSALASDAEIDADTRQLISAQQVSLKNSHDIIKKHRDMHKAANS